MERKYEGQIQWSTTIYKQLLEVINVVLVCVCWVTEASDGAVCSPEDIIYLTRVNQRHAEIM